MSSRDPQRFKTLAFVVVVGGVTGVMVLEAGVMVLGAWLGSALLSCFCTVGLVLVTERI